MVRLRSKKGAVALEALLSMVLLFVTFYAMWSTAQVIYQQSRLNTAVQLAAVGGLIEYNRTVPRGNEDDVDRTSSSARVIAEETFRDNFCNDSSYIGAEGGGAGGTTSCPLVSGGTGSFSITFLCSPGINDAYGNGQCRTGSKEDARALAARVRAEVEQSWVLASVYNGFFSISNQPNLTLTSQSTTYAYSAEDGP